MAETIRDGHGDPYILRILSGGTLPVSGIVGVTFSNDYVGVYPSGTFHVTAKASGAYVAVSGQVNTNLYAGSESWEQNFPSQYPGSNVITNTVSVAITNDPVPVSGNLGVVFDPTDTLSVTPSGTFTVDTQLYAGSGVWQGTSPWVTSGQSLVSGTVTANQGGTWNVNTVTTLPKTQVYGSGAFITFGSGVITNLPSTYPVSGIVMADNNPPTDYTHNPKTVIVYSGTAIGSIYEMTGAGSYVQVLSYTGANLIGVRAWSSV